MKRLGLIGDVHAEDQRLEAALRYLTDEAVDRILCVGDLSDGKGDLDRCVALLRRYDVVAIRGNHDRWLLADSMRELDDTQRAADLAPETRAFLEALPATRRLETSAGPLHLCHGLGKHDMLRVGGAADLEWQLTGSGYGLQEALDQLGIDADVRVLVAGHTHDRWAGRAGPFLVVNPGTLRRSDGAGFAIVDLGEAAPEVRFYDIADDLRIMACARSPAAPR